MKVDWVPLGEVASLRRSPVDVDPTASYREIGIRSFGKGCFIKEPVSGTEIGDKKIFQIKYGDLLFSNVFAWEGAVAVSDERHEDLVGSHRFMTWECTPERASAEFLRDYFLSDRGLAELRKASPGSAGRNKTLSIKNLERLRVPLPSLAEQTRIAEHLRQIGREHKSTTRQDPSRVALDSTLSAWLGQLPAAPLGELIEFAPKPRKVDSADEVQFVPMAAVDPITGTITNVEVKSRGEVGTGYRQFIPGDVIFARITPCMQNGNCAIYVDELGRTGYGSSEFFVLRASSPEFAEWVWRVLRTEWFTSQARRAFTGTAGQQRVPADFVKTVAFPLPGDDELAGAIERIRTIQELRLTSASLHGKRNELAVAVLPAARNEIFTAMH